MGKVSVAKPKKSNKPGLSNEQARELSRLERLSWKIIKNCWRCHTKPTKGCGFPWGAVALLRDDGTVDENEVYAIRYEFVTSEKEKVFHEGRFKAVSFIFLILILFYFFFIFV
jgi:hypothetical protein